MTEPLYPRSAVGCTCQSCALKHGDQADSVEELEASILRTRIRELEADNLNLRHEVDSKAMELGTLRLDRQYWHSRARQLEADNRDLIEARNSLQKQNDALHAGLRAGK